MRIPVLLFLLMTPGLSMAQNVETLWKARGLLAEEKIAVLSKKSESKTLTKNEKCELQLEKSFATLVDKTMSQTLVYKNGKNLAITIPFFEKDKMALSLAFVYSENQKMPYMVHPIFHVVGPESLIFTLMFGRVGGSFAIGNKSCSFYFDPPELMNPTIVTQ